jgi:hypothetical protein
MIMKKRYMKPNMKVVDVKPRSILCGSITPQGNNLRVTFSDDGDFGDDDTIN